MDRENFKNKAKQAIDDMFAKIDELEAKRGKIHGEAKAEYDNMIKQMKKRKDQLVAKYNKLKSIKKDEEWDEVKKSFSSASRSFREGISKIGDLLK